MLWSALSFFHPFRNYILISVTAITQTIFLSSLSANKYPHANSKERQIKSPQAFKRNRLTSTIAAHSHPRLPVGNSSFAEGSDLRIPSPSSSYSPRNQEQTTDEGRKRKTLVGSMEIPVVSVATQIFGIRERERDRVSINFRPIFNFTQDALLCHAKQAANLVVLALRPSRSFRKYLGDCKLRGSFPRRLRTTPFTQCCCHLYSAATVVYRVPFCRYEILCAISSEFSLCTKMSRHQWF